VAAQNTNQSNSSLSAKAQELARLTGQQSRKQYNRAGAAAGRGAAKFNQALQNDPAQVNEWLNHGVNAFNTVSKTVWRGGPNGLFTGTPEFGPLSVQPSRVPLSEAPQLDPFELQAGPAAPSSPPPGSFGPLPPPIGGPPWQPRPGQQPNPGPGGPPTSPPGGGPPPPPTGPDDDDDDDDKDPGFPTVGPFDDWAAPDYPSTPLPPATYPTVDPLTGKVKMPDAGPPLADPFAGMEQPPFVPLNQRKGRAPYPTVDPATGRVRAPSPSAVKAERQAAADKSARAEADRNIPQADPFAGTTPPPFVPLNQRKGRAPFHTVDPATGRIKKPRQGSG